MLRILRVAGRRVALRLPQSSSTYSHNSSSSFYSLTKEGKACNQKWQSSSTVQATRLLHITSARACQMRLVEVPQLAESISEGDIRFEKAVGDSIAMDEVIGEIETDKTSVAINSPVSGIIEELLVEDGSTVRPGQQVVRIRVSGEGEAAPAPAKKAPQTESKPKVETPAESSSASAPSFVSAPAPPAVPSQPISTTSTTSHAPHAQASVESGSFGSPNRTEQRVKINRMRARIAQRLKDAQNTYAMLTTFNEIDMTNAIEMRNLHKDAFAKRHNLKLGFMSAFVAASVHALKHMPTVNAVIDENEIIYRDYIDISVAVATPKGLVVPVLRNCENMNFAQIEQNIALLGEKARNNALAIEDMDGGTFTISNGGVFGSLMGTPIINPPQSAILGMHSIVERPVVVNKQIVIRPMMYVALTYDHRLIDGREAVTFLRKIKAVVEDPRVLQLDL